MPTGVEPAARSALPVTPRVATVVVLVALVLAPLGPVNRGLPVAAVVLGAVVAIKTARPGSEAVFRLAVFVLVLALSSALEAPFGIWIGVALVTLGAARVPRLRPEAGWLPSGTMNPAAWSLAAATVVVAAVALAVWAGSTSDFGQSTEDLVDLVRDLPLGVLVSGAVCFVLINAVAEEVAYRGFAFDAATESLPPATAILAQAAAFGAAHIAGFPAGAIGVGLAATYGAALGALRQLTRGMRAPVLVHIAADAVIVVLFITVVLPE